MSTNSPSDNPQAAFQNAVLQKTSGAPIEPETHLWSGGYSPKAMFGTWILSLISSVIVVVAIGLAPTFMPNFEGTQILWMVGGGIIGLWWLYAIATYAYRRVSVHYELTTQRFIHTHGILTRTTDRIEVLDIDDVTFSQGLVQRILGVGTIILSSSDRSHPNLRLEGIDKVSEISGLIDDTRRKERRKRSLHIEAS